MSIFFQNKVLFSAAIPQVPPGTTTTGTLATYDLTSGGPGNLDAGDCIIAIYVRINEHSETSGQKTHGYLERASLFTYLGGALTALGPSAGINIEAMTDTGNPGIINFQVSGTQILITVDVEGPENGTGTFSGILEIHLAD